MSLYVGQLSDFCVFGFAFLSGYGHMFQYDKPNYYKRRLKGLLSVFCSYWLILIVFSIIGTAIGQGDYMPGSARKFILNALTLEKSYNGAWWYMFTYAILVVISPLILKWVKHCNPIWVLGIGFAVYCIAYYVRFELNYSNWFLNKFGASGMTFFEYLMGAEAFQYHIFSRIYQRWNKLPKIVQDMFSVILMLGMLYGHTKIVPSLFIAPITGFVIMMLFHFWKKPNIIQKVFLILGKHATNIWLTHMFFYLCLFKNLVYIAKYPLLILIFMLVITLLLSIFLQQIEKPIQKQIAKI